MTKHDILERLVGRLTEIKQRYGVRTISVFGSIARGEVTDPSDVDILVSFEQAADFDRFMDLKFYLEDLLGTRVDLVTENALREPVRQAIQEELIHVSG